MQSFSKASYDYDLRLEVVMISQESTTKDVKLFGYSQKPMSAVKREI